MSTLLCGISLLCTRRIISKVFRQPVKYPCISHNNSVIQFSFPKIKESYSIHAPCKVPVTMKLSPSQVASILTEDVKFLHQLFTKNGYEIRIAGGAVRDILQGHVPSDLDFATTATPEEMRDMFNQNQIRLINSKGESHGTITTRINENNYEITTLRIDQKTDGRHAQVKFTTDWYLDACRRDLTINAMFLDFDGTVYDYFNGHDDLLKRRVIFVGDATHRIKEDYLRILRYFRFYGKIAEKPDNHDEETLAAIRSNAEGLSIISGERIQTELYKIISGNFGIELLKKIIELDIGQYIGLPVKCSVDELNRVSEIFKKNNLVADPVTVLCSLFHDELDVEKFVMRIKPSGYHRDLAYFIVEHKDTRSQQPVRFYQKLVLLSKKENFTKSAVREYLKYMGDVKTLKEFEEWKRVPFPVSGDQIIGKGVGDRRQVGIIRQELLSHWIDSNFTLTREELIDLIPEVAARYTPTKSIKAKK